MIQGVIVICRTGYTPEPYQQMFLFWAAIAFAVLINILASTLLPKIEGFVLLLYFAEFFAVLLPLAILGEHQDPHQVFGQWMNQGKFPTQGISFMVGLIGAYFVFAGADGAIHVSNLTFEVLQWMLSLMCLDVRRDPKLSDCRPMVDPHQHHFEWGFGGGDDDRGTLRGRRSEFGPEFKPWIHIHRDFH